MQNELSRHIKKLRKQKELTQGELADLLKIPRTTYAKKELEGDFILEEIPALYKNLGGSKEELENLIRKQGSTNVENWRELLIKNAIDTAAMNRVILMALAEILGKQKNESVAKVLSELTKAVEAEKSMIKS